MYSKTFAMGGCGGLIMTKHKHLYELALSFADRGKPFGPLFNVRNTDSYLFPSFNFNADELSCAIGFSILKKSLLYHVVVVSLLSIFHHLSISIVDYSNHTFFQILIALLLLSSLSIHIDHTKVSSDVASYIKQILNDDQLIPSQCSVQGFCSFMEMVALLIEPIFSPIQFAASCFFCCQYFI